MEKGVDINYRDKNGGTALMAACHWGNNDIAKILLEKGADVNLGTNNQFFTSPLLSAYFKKNLELVNILLQYNADV
jgi:ankyrin repeat protein